MSEVEHLRHDTATPPVSGAKYVGVVFDRPLDHAYTYSVPDALFEQVAIGKRVTCSFGRGDRGTVGYIVQVSDQAPPREVKAISAVIDDVALLDASLLSLTRWMADYYLCGWGQVLHAVVPAGARENAGTRSATFLAAVPTEELPHPLPTVTPKQKLVLDAVRKAGSPIESGELARQQGVGASVINGLVSKGLIRKFSERVERHLDDMIESGPDARRAATELEMNADQLRVWEPIRTALSANHESNAASGFQAFLLHGVTGSGKTEIYLRAIAEVVRQGKEAIVLVPEISLTPQTTDRFRGRFGQVAVLHSNLTDAERGGYWRRVAAGRVNVVVGARSAVFAPTRKLGLIVIDEEHENTFKQESTPRYHARDVAVMRARLANVPIIMGSATPSLESWHAAQEGTYTRLDMPNRVANRPMPRVAVIDMRHEPKQKGQFYAIGPTLEAAMTKAMDDGGQVILLLNRRGFSTHVHCPACGHVAQCQHCDLAVTFHREKAALVCHSCGWEALPLTQCPQCKQPAIRYQGLGTEKLESELQAKFSDRVVRRMDSDTMTHPESHRRVLDAFRDRQIDILFGTQMIAKGLDFPNVTLVGVVNADVGLHVPDFRAAERTFQLLAQVAGRAGRGDKGGRVLVQTFSPDHPCIQYAAKHDFIGFANLELNFRKEHQYPPYQRMARVIVRSENPDAAGTFADTMAGAFKQAVVRLVRKRSAGMNIPVDPSSLPPVRVLGPAECPVFKLHDNYRFHFQIQAENSGELHEVLREVLTVCKPPSHVEFQVDVDPYSMM